MRSHEWGDSPLGDPATWPPALRLLATLMLGSKFPMFVAWGPDLGFIYNDAYLEVLGAKHPDALGRSFQAIWSEIWSDIHPFIERALSGEATFSEDLPLRMMRNGFEEDTWFTFSYSPARNEDGSIGGMFCACVETTGRVVAERARQKSDERLELALTAGHGIGTWDWDVPGDRVVADRQFARLYGVDPDRAAAGAPIADFFRKVHPDDIARVQTAVAQALSSGRPLVEEYRLTKPDGSVCWVVAQGTCALAADGTPLRFPGVSFDITERKTAELRLRELNTDLEREVRQRSRERGKIWDLSPDLIGVLNEHGYFESSNPAWQVTLGWTPEEVGRTPFFDFLHPDDLDRNHVAFDAALQGQPALKFENRYRHKDGGFRWLSWVAIPDGAKIYCSARDITPEKVAETELAQAQDALRQAQKMEAVGQLTGGVAHDFNNLLTIIKSSTDLLRRPDLAEERRRRYVEAISDTVERASRLTGQLLSFARRQALQPEIFDVGKNVAAIADMVGTLAGSRIRIESVAPDQPCCIDADPSQFDTAIVNLAVNARDAMDGEGRLTIKVRAVPRIPAIRHHAELEGDFVAVSLTDTGAGIPEHRLEQIFEPFFTTKDVGQGTGLGLSQVFGFAKQSGGDVAVESEIGRGTTFTIYLPRVRESGALAHAPERGPAQGDTGDGCRVLVVEDNVEVGTFSTQLLQDLGYETVWAPDAQQALVLLGDGRHAFDVVFSDVVMPGMSGIEFGQEVRRAFPTLPVILTSGYSHVLAQEGLKGFELLKKPYAAEDLSKMLRRVSGRRETAA